VEIWGGGDLSCYSNKIQPVRLRKCLYDHQPTNKADLIDITVANISQAHKMAPKTSWQRYGTNLRQKMTSRGLNPPKTLIVWAWKKVIGLVLSVTLTFRFQVYFAVLRLGFSGIVHLESRVPGHCRWPLLPLAASLIRAETGAGRAEIVWAGAERWATAIETVYERRVEISPFTLHIIVSFSQCHSMYICVPHICRRGVALQLINTSAYRPISRYRRLKHRKSMTSSKPMASTSLRQVSLT